MIYGALSEKLITYLLVLVLTIIGMGFYNLCVTGNPMRMAYQIHEERYVMAPTFLWQRLPVEPEYHHKVIRDFNATYALPFYTTQRSILGFLIRGYVSDVKIGISGAQYFFDPSDSRFSFTYILDVAESVGAPGSPNLFRSSFGSADGDV